MKKNIEDFNPTVTVLTPEEKDLIEKFNSGVFAFNNYINKEAFRDMMSGSGVTYLIENTKSDGDTELVAYYSISAAAIVNIYIDDYDEAEADEEEKDNEGKKTDVKAEADEEEKTEYLCPISAFMINMFAVNSKYQDSFYRGELISSLVLKYIIAKLNELSISVIGAKMIILCSVPDAVEFYKKNKFKKLDNNYTILDKVDAIDNIPMYLSLHEI